MFSGCPSFSFLLATPKFQKVGTKAGVSGLSFGLLGKSQNPFGVSDGGHEGREDEDDDGSGAQGECRQRNCHFARVFHAFLLVPSFHRKGGTV